jgi:hypothetical protein
MRRLCLLASATKKANVKTNRGKNSFMFGVILYLVLQEERFCKQWMYFFHSEKVYMQKTSILIALSECQQ